MFIFGPFVAREWSRLVKASAESMNYTIRLRPEEMVFMKILDVTIFRIARIRRPQFSATIQSGQLAGKENDFTLRLMRRKEGN